MIGREDEVRGYRERVKLFNFLIAIGFMIILSRLFYLQVMKGDDLRRFSEANRLKKEKLQATRGILFDRNGKVIVDNRAAFDVVLLSQYYKPKEGSDKRLAKALQITDAELEKKLRKIERSPSFYPILLKADVSKDVLAAIEMDAEGFSGVDIEATVQRRYPYKEIAAQMLGYVGEVDPKDIKRDPTKYAPGDLIGKMGIERNYDDYLRGSNGVGYVEVDAMGRRKKAENSERLLGYISQNEPVPGDNIYLTLDADLQVAAANAFKSRNYMGSAVALDPRSGELLALVNYPSYDPEMISGREIDQKTWNELRENKEHPLRNRAIQDHYPPGSTFKPLVAVAALAEGVATTKRSVQCNGSLPFGNRRFGCWKRHGLTDFTRAIKESCDVFFYQMGIDLGIDKIAKYARLLGLGERTGIKITGEQRGLIPDSEWKKKTYHDIWHPGETLSVAIGQGYVTATPLQLATAYAAIANGGFVYRPYVIRRIEGRNGEIVKEFQPELIRKIEIPTEVFEAVKEGLYRVVNEPGGTAFLSKSKLTTMSGKTGTAQVRNFADISKIKNCTDLPYHFRHHGLFVGFAPRENPQIAVAIVAEHQCHGSNAGHLAQEIVDAYMIKQAQLAGQPIPEKGKTKVAVFEVDVNKAKKLEGQAVAQLAKATKEKKKLAAEKKREREQAAARDDDEDTTVAEPELAIPPDPTPVPQAAEEKDGD